MKERFREIEREVQSDEERLKERFREIEREV